MGWGFQSRLFSNRMGANKRCGSLSFYFYLSGELAPEISDLGSKTLERDTALIGPRGETLPLKEEDDQTKTHRTESRVLT